MAAPNEEGLSSPPFMVAPENATAWQHLPAAAHGTGAPLPVWARALAPNLPCTVAAMLELDYQHRVKSPLEAELRAVVRRAVAQANACRYGEAEAEADLHRAGPAESPSTRRPAVDGDVLAFARKLTLAGATVSDDEVASLRQRYGDKQLVALVQLIAYANFQDRLLRALGLDRQLDETAAAAVSFTRQPLGTTLIRPRQKPPASAGGVGGLAGENRAGVAGDAAAILMQMESQKTRRPRIALSDAAADVVHWGEVCRKHQPELTGAWFVCMRSFGAEAYQDPVLEASVLWVVSRTQRSFY